uniref:DNA dC->dU-editing enzyme APOBEC-3B-like n=1 Tax=Euleptes europaea TaxID=460621 RepID=UPI0025401AA3|nr:DNA dC->dU-editing enzyme APOBEC-3B-like [Euleptes europaea]
MDQSNSTVDPSEDYSFTSTQGASVIDYMLIGDSCLSKVLEFKVSDYGISNHLLISINILIETTPDLGQAGSTDERWRIEPETFQRNYTPIGPPKVTHLLYEIHWGRSPRTWKQWCTSNGNQHAEINFLENACEVIKSRRTTPCSVTWFLSWSPCGRCSHSIIEFLNEHPNVTLNIRVSYLFNIDDRRNQNGLRALVENGVQISVMHLPDYGYCWRTFVSHQKRRMGNGYILLCLRFRWTMEPDVFKRNYTPVQHPKLTYLLYEIHWGKSYRTWKHWCRNDDNHHAEINFFEDFCKEIEHRRTQPCSVTWFLSWSPCDECSQFIIEFLKKHPNVTLDIRASRLFKDWEKRNKTGLRALVDHGVHISIMHPGDYSYCWRTFVAHQRNENENKGYMQFFQKICDWNEELRLVLE